ncbi:hypothetical protein DW073_06855 [Ruminococcus sp. AF45-4BH]|nr:hypothetical protein DW073_06855 [Ruminococcus sp. AF45-4BH]
MSLAQESLHRLSEHLLPFLQTDLRFSWNSDLHESSFCHL